MKNWIHRLTAFLIAALMLCPACFAIGDKSGDADLPAEMIRVGLFYGAAARTEVSLDTNAENGYRLGFYDESRVLHAIARIGSQQVVVAPNTNAQLSCGDVYGIHLRLPASFESFEDASDSARSNGGFPAFCNGLFYVMIGSYATAEEAQNALDALGREAEIYYDAGRGVVVVSADTAEPLFLFDYSSTHALVLAPDDTGKPATKCGEYRYRGNFQFNRVGSSALTVVNCVGLEDYVKGVIPNEMSASWPEEALKAQAVCARTYALKNLNGYRIYGFDVTEDTNSQVYRGLREADDVTDGACDATAGEVLRYNDELCAVYYFAADGGATVNSEDVWNDVAVPYLTGVADPYESEIDFYCKSWSAAVSRGQMGEITADLDENGNVRTVKAGDKVYKNDAVRDFLHDIGAPYNSRHFQISFDEASNAYSIAGNGFGHNLGMSQWGAMAMAEKHDMNYKEILAYYFTGATVV